MIYKITKNERIKKLIDENKEKLLSADTTTPVKKNGVCFDGIVNESEFENCSKKVIFLLKETNGNTKIKNKDGITRMGLPEVLNDWDYRQWLQEHQASPDSSNSGEFY